LWELVDFGLIDKGGFSLKQMCKINVVLGKNGSGKSTILKRVKEAIEHQGEVEHSKYITPERGGSPET